MIVEISMHALAFCLIVFIYKITDRNNEFKFAFTFLLCVHSFSLAFVAMFFWGEIAIEFDYQRVQNQ